MDESSRYLRNLKQISSPSLVVTEDIVVTNMKKPFYTFQIVPFRPLPYIEQERNDLSPAHIEAVFPYTFNSVFCVCLSFNP